MQTLIQLSITKNDDLFKINDKNKPNEGKFS